MAAKRGQQRVEQRRAIRLRLQLPPAAPLPPQAVAQRARDRAGCPALRRAGPSARASRASPSARHARARDGSRPRAASATSAKPLLDRALVGQRRGDVLGEQPPAGGSLAAVDVAEQAAGDAAGRRPGELEAIAARRVDRHVARRARSAAARRAGCRRPSGSRRGRRADRPAAASSARVGEPRPSSVARPKRLLSARSPAMLSNPPLPADRAMPGNGVSAIVSAGASRASSAASSPGPQLTSSNRPVEMSAAAIAHSSPARPIAASQLADADSSNVSSVRVPGVTSRTIARSTSALDPRALRASAGLSVCSAMATRWPARISRARYDSAEWTGTPHIGIGSPASSPRLVSAISRLAEAALASSKNSSKKSPIR